MGATFEITAEQNGEDCVLLRVGFGEVAENDRIVVDAERAMRELKLAGGRLVKFNGRASLPVAMVLCHAVAHIYAAVAVFDPKLAMYVVCVSHDPKRPVGMLLE